MVVPVSSSILPKLRIRKVRNKVGNWGLPEVEGGPEQHGNGIDGTELNMAVADGPMLICAPCLIVLGIVQEDAEYLFHTSRKSVSSVPYKTMQRKDLTSIPPDLSPSGEGMTAGKRSDSWTARQLPPRSAVVVDRSSIARSRSPTKISLGPLKSVRQKREHRSSSSFV